MASPTASSTASNRGRSPAGRQGCIRRQETDDPLALVAVEKRHLVPAIVEHNHGAGPGQLAGILHVALAYSANQILAFLFAVAAVHGRFAGTRLRMPSCLSPPLY